MANWSSMHWNRIIKWTYGSLLCVKIHFSWVVSVCMYGNHKTAIRNTLHWDTWFCVPPCKLYLPPQKSVQELFFGPKAKRHRSAHDTLKSLPLNQHGCTKPAYWEQSPAHAIGQCCSGFTWEECNLSWDKPCHVRWCEWSSSSTQLYPSLVSLTNTYAADLSLCSSLLKFDVLIQPDAGEWLNMWSSHSALCPDIPEF